MAEGVNINITVKVSKKMTYRVRENTRPIYNVDGSVFMHDYYVYCSNEFTDYYEALKFAIEHEKKGGYKCWVDCMDTYEFYDDEVAKNLAEIENSSYALT